MSKYILRRLLGIVPLLLGITIISFALIHLAPGKPTVVEQSLNQKVSPETRLRLEKLYGLDKPLPVQYMLWVKRLARFDFGTSLTDGRPVSKKVMERIPLTLTINILSMAGILILALLVGIEGALRRDSLFDKASTFISFLFFATPSFWLALLAMEFFSIRLGILPVSGIKSLDFEYFSWSWKFWDLARHLCLPLAISVVGGFAGIARYLRSRMLEVLDEPYMCTARAKGLKETQVIYRHGLRNALLPIVTILGLSVPGLLGGSVIFESIFALPGIGRLFYEAVMTRDYPLIMAEVVLGAVLTMLGNLIADISYAFVDPRIRYRK